MGPFIITGKIGVWRELRFVGGSPSRIRFQCLKPNYLHTKHKQPPYKRTVGFPLRSKLNDWSNSKLFSHKTPTCNKDFLPFSTYFWFSALLFFLWKRSIVLQNDRYTKRRGRNWGHCTDGSGAWYSVFCHVTQRSHLNKEKNPLSSVRDIPACWA